MTRSAGILLSVIGGFLILLAFAYDTTVHSAGSLIGGDYIGGRSTHNLGLLQTQMMILHTGLICFLAGIVLLASPRAEQERRPTSATAEARNDETEDERDERLARVRNTHKAMGLLFATAILLLLIGGMLTG